MALRGFAAQTPPHSEHSQDRMAGGYPGQLGPGAGGYFHLALEGGGGGGRGGTGRTAASVSCGPAPVCHTSSRGTEEAGGDRSWNVLIF